MDQKVYEQVTNVASCGVRTLLTGLTVEEVEPVKQQLADSWCEVLGTKVDQVLRRASCPVLVVRPRGGFPPTGGRGLD